MIKSHHPRKNIKRLKKKENQFSLHVKIKSLYLKNEK